MWTELLRTARSDTSAIPVPDDLLIASPQVIYRIYEEMHKSGERDYCNNAKCRNNVDF